MVGLGRVVDYRGQDLFDQNTERKDVSLAVVVERLRRRRRLRRSLFRRNASFVSERVRAFEKRLAHAIEPENNEVPS